MKIESSYTTIYPPFYRKQVLTIKNKKIMKKILFFAAMVGVAFTSCMNEEFIGDNSPTTSQETPGAINFNMSTPAVTRATQEDATAAATLGNKFIVWGEKNESSGTAATAGNIVFQNYTVQYGASTAHTTLSNTDDWEYVGVTSYTTKLTPNAPTPQTIKYWDNGATSYTFTAVSALDADITGDKVVITKETSGTTKYDKGYTIAVKIGASSGNIFFADRISDTPANLNSSAVKFTFRNLQAKLRFGIYETVPGYTVSIDKVYYHSTNSTSNFGVDGKFIKPADNTSFTVTYGNGTTTGPENKAIVAVSADTYDSYLASTSTTIMEATSIGTTSPGATMDSYVSILPYPSNTTDLSFTIDYTLKSEDTNEIIAITGKTVNVPAAFCKWQANYAYTYLFKITDSELTPITFDACYVEDEVGNQETITTVDNPSITTYAKGVNPTAAAKAEYPTSSNIYVTVDKGGTVQTLIVDTNAKLYLVTNDTGSGETQEITEASVANALAKGTKDDPSTPTTWTVTGVGMKDLIVTTAGVPTLTATSSIAAEDSPTGVAIDLDGTNNKCAKFTPTAAGTYAFEFIARDQATGTYVSGTTYYTDAVGVSVVDTSGFTEGSTDVSSYYVGDPKKYYKVIKVVAP